MDHTLLKKNHTLPINFLERLTTKPSKICFQRADRLGDMVLCLPAVHAIKQAFPLAELHMICSPKNNQLIELLDIFNHSFCIDIDHATEKEKKQFTQQLLDQKYDILINFWAHPFFETMARKLKDSITIGQKEMYFLNSSKRYRVKIDWSNMFKHEVDFNLSFLKPFNLDITKDCHLSIPSHTTQKAKTILIFCSTGNSNMNLTDQQTVELVKGLLQLRTFHIILTYGEIIKESPLLNLLDKDLTNIVKLLPLSQLIHLISTCEYYIGPDTGPTHIASFLNKKVVVIFRNKNNPPVRWGPQSDCFKIVRLDYMSLKKKEQNEVQEILSGITDLSQNIEKKQTDFEKRLSHLKHSLRICIDFNSVKEYKLKKQIIHALRKKGWSIFLHINRKNPYKQLKAIFKKYKNYHFNVFLSDNKRWWHYLLLQKIHSDLKPSPLIISVAMFEAEILKQLNLLSDKD